MDTVFNRQTIKTQPGNPVLAHTPRGFRVDFSPIADAMRPPQINSRGFVAGEMALAEVGQGLQSLGGSLMAIQEEMAESVNRRHVAEAEIALEEAKANIAAEIAAERDPAKWPIIAQKAMAHARKVAIPEGASPKARAMLEPYATKWEISTAGEIKVASIKRTLQLEADTYGAGFQRAINNKNYPEAVDWARRGVDAGAFSAEHGEKLAGMAMRQREADMVGTYKAGVSEAVRNEDFESVAALNQWAFNNKIINEAEYKNEQDLVVKGQLVKDIKSEIRRDPIAAMKALETWQLPDADRRNLEHLAESQLKDYQTDEIRDIADKVATKEITRGEQVKFKWITSPAERLEITDKINDVPLTVEEMTPIVLRLDSRIANLDAVAVNDRDPQATMEMLDISATINRLPSHVRDRYAGKLRSALDGKRPSTKDSYVSEGKKILADILEKEEAAFFRYDSSKRKLFLIPGKEKEYVALRLRITKMENDLESLMPDNPTPEKAAEVLNQVTGSAVSAERKKAYGSPDFQNQRWNMPILPDPSNPEMRMPYGEGTINPMLFRSGP